MREEGLSQGGAKAEYRCLGEALTTGTRLIMLLQAMHNDSPGYCLHNSFQKELDDIKLSIRPSVGQGRDGVGGGPVCSGLQDSSIRGSSAVLLLSDPTLKPDFFLCVILIVLIT